MIDIHLSGAIYDDLRRAAEDLRAPLDAVITDLLSDRVALGLQAPSSEWRAIPAVIATLSVPLPDKLLSELHMLASGAGQQLPVVIYNLLNVALPSEPPPLPLGYLRTEPGRGRVFGMYFEIAGFQYALLRHLAGDHLSVRQNNGCGLHIACTSCGEFRKSERPRDFCNRTTIRDESDDDRKQETRPREIVTCTIIGTKRNEGARRIG